MKKYFLSVAAILLLSGSVLFSSCIGSFHLTKNLLAWNQTIDSNFANELVFLALWIIPVYEVVGLVDLLVLNSIEFWTGENPIHAGIVTKVQGRDGIYTVETLENGYRIENEKGAEMQFVYDKETNIWSAVTDNNSIKVLKIEEDKTATVYLPNGMEQNVELSQQGLLAFRQSIESNLYFASR